MTLTAVTRSANHSKIDRGTQAHTQRERERESHTHTHTGTGGQADSLSNGCCCCFCCCWISRYYIVDVVSGDCQRLSAAVVLFDRLTHSVCLRVCLCLCVDDCFSLSAGDFQAQFTLAKRQMSIDNCLLTHWLCCIRCYHRLLGLFLKNKRIGYRLYITLCDKLEFALAYI